MSNEKLLNFRDISVRMVRNPEPQEISETREKIITSFSDLVLQEKEHKYFVKKYRKRAYELPSVSSTIERWVPKVDWDEKAEMKALRLGIEKEELLKQWHEANIISTSCGSKTHFFGENAMNLFIGKEAVTANNMSFQYTEDGYLIPYNGKEWAITQYYNDILSNDNVYPVMPEAKIYTNYNDIFKLKYPYAGTFDILLAYKYKGEIVYSIHDFKTNASLHKDYAHEHNIMMLPPFDDMFEEPYSHYAIQLSLYQIGLMQLGIKVVDRNIIWLKEDGTYEKIKTPDLTETLIKELS